MESSNIEQKMGRATAWSSVTEVASKLIAPITNMILARLLVPEAFGVVATINMVISFADIFTDAGFQKYIIQHEFPDDEALDNSTNVAFWTNLGLSCFICFFIFLFRHSLAELVGSPGLGNSIGLASFLIIITAFSSIQTARYRRDLDFKKLFFVRVGTSLIPLFITVPLAIILRNYWALLLGTFTSKVFHAVILTIWSKWKPRIFYRFALFKEMFAFSAWTLLESISIWLTSYIGIFIIGKYLNEYYIGIYKTSISTVDGYMAIITAALTPVLFSGLSRYQNDEKKFKQTYYLFQRLTALFVLPMGIGIYVYRDFVTQILLGSQWGEASGFIGLWGLTSSFTIVLSNFASEVYRSKGQPKVSLLMQIIQLLFLIPTLIFSIPHGFETLYTARALVRVVTILNAMLMMHFMFDFKAKDIFLNIFPMLFSAVIMGVCGFFIRQLSLSGVWQFASVFLCILLYFAILFVAFPRTRREIITRYMEVKRKKPTKADIM